MPSHRLPVASRDSIWGDRAAGTPTAKAGDGPGPGARQHPSALAEAVPLDPLPWPWGSRWLTSSPGHHLYFFWNHLLGAGPVGGRVRIIYRRPGLSVHVGLYELLAAAVTDEHPLSWLKQLGVFSSVWRAEVWQGSPGAKIRVRAGLAPCGRSCPSTASREAPPRILGLMPRAGLTSASVTSSPPPLTRALW